MEEKPFGTARAIHALVTFAAVSADAAGLVKFEHQGCLLITFIKSNRLRCNQRAQPGSPYLLLIDSSLYSRLSQVAHKPYSGRLLELERNSRARPNHALSILYNRIPPNDENPPDNFKTADTGLTFILLDFSRDSSFLDGLRT